MSYYFHYLNDSCFFPHQEIEPKCGEALCRMFPTDEAIDVVEILRDARRRRREQASRGGPPSGGGGGGRRGHPMRLGLQQLLGLVTLINITCLKQCNKPCQPGFIRVQTQPGWVVIIPFDDGYSVRTGCRHLQCKSSQTVKSLVSAVKPFSGQPTWVDRSMAKYGH